MYAISTVQLQQVFSLIMVWFAGLFSYDHMDFEWDRANKTKPDQPSLSEMVKKAIGLLEKNDDGFVLLVEGGRIDQVGAYKGLTLQSLVHINHSWRMLMLLVYR